MRFVTQLTLCFVAVCSLAAAPAPDTFFEIQVVDDATGRGVPMVELKTVSNISYCTDSAGRVAFYEPGLMDRDVYFGVTSHGYDMPRDGFGSAGKILHTKTGASATIRIKRLNIAERLYRLTGEGIYRDTVMLGKPSPIKQPLLNGQVSGQDSTLAVVHNGKVHWFWGDTSRPKYPLGNFHMSGATSLLPKDGGLDPAVGIDLTYFVNDEGFCRAMAPLKGEGIVWVEGITTLPDATGRQRILGRYARLKGLGHMLELGTVLYNDDKDIFEKVRDIDMSQQWRAPFGHPFTFKDGDTTYCYYNPGPFPVVRSKATVEDATNPAAFIAFTCLSKGSRWDKSAPKVDRDGQGRVVYGWKPDTDPTGPEEEKRLVGRKLLSIDEARFLPRDVASGKPIQLHRGSVAWNEYRKKWISIAGQTGGESSFLGEIWYAEADAPTGPWRSCVKVVTHDKYSFYNPVHHPFFDQQDGKVIYFEGTYTVAFSGNDHPTPRYDYNQIMYRLDLSDPRLGSAQK